MKGLLPHSGEQTEWVIQYTFNGEDPRIRSTINVLQEIAANDGRLSLHGGFWSDRQLHDNLSRTDLFVFTYDGDVYRDKNSGILWLLGWYQCPLLFLEPSWLTREADRLGLTFSTLEKESSSFKEITEQIKILSQKAQEGASHLKMNEEVKAYRNLVYDDFYEWIMRLNSRLT